MNQINILVWIKFKAYILFLKEKRENSTYGREIKFNNWTVYFFVPLFINNWKKWNLLLLQLKEDENVKKIIEILPPLYSFSSKAFPFFENIKSALKLIHEQRINIIARKSFTKWMADLWNRFFLNVVIFQSRLLYNLYTQFWNGKV